MGDLHLKNWNLPLELRAPSKIPIGVNGLDTVNNAIHKSIWNFFDRIGGVHRKCLNLRLIDNAHEFLTAKPKRISYDKYLPNGILKRNWMNKHLNVVPAVIAVFFDLEWADNLWNERIIELSSRIQSLRSALKGHDTQLLLVIIQVNIIQPVDKDPFAFGRRAYLCSACGITKECLTLMEPHNQLRNYVYQVEMAFYDKAQIYYQHMIRCIKNHKEHLNRPGHQLLLVRHEFKIGFLYELKQEPSSAHKYYSQAYKSLLDVSIMDSNAFELRTVAGIIGYKKCALLFRIARARDAVLEFKAHIDRFKRYSGYQELAFEHYEWLSNQNGAFGDLFDEAVKRGLPTLQTQHPGIYYYKAAQNATHRKRSCQKLCADSIEYPNPDPLANSTTKCEYFGQRPWRVGKTMLDALEPHVEMAGIQALQYLEQRVPHSANIIALFGLAIAQYKVNNCPRARRRLILQMAGECYESQDYGKALTLMTHMLRDLRMENWPDVLSDVLQDAIRCAFLTANRHDCVLLALEGLGKNLTLSLEYKRKLHTNIQRILTRQIPFGIRRIANEGLQKVSVLWQPYLVVQDAVERISVNLANVITCIECKATFQRERCGVDQLVDVELFLRSTAPLPLIFSRFSVLIVGLSDSTELSVQDANFELRPNEVERYHVSYKPNIVDTQYVLKIASAHLSLGQEQPNCCVFDLQYSFQSSTTADILTTIPPELRHFQRLSDPYRFDTLVPQLHTRVVAREAHVTCQPLHDPPILLGEWYKLVLKVLNEDDTIKDVAAKLSDPVCVMNVREQDASECASSHLVEVSTSQVNGRHTVVVPPNDCHLTMVCGDNDDDENDLPSNEIRSTALWIRASKAPTKLCFTFDLSFKSNQTVPCVKRYTLDDVDVVCALDLSVRFMQLDNMAETQHFYVNEEIMVLAQVRCVAPLPIVIARTELELESHMEFTANGTNKPSDRRVHKLPGQTSSHILQPDECYADWFAVRCTKKLEKAVAAGQYRVFWRRIGTESLPTTLTHLDVMGHICEFVALDIQLSLPAHGFVRTPLMVTYYLYNRSAHLIQLLWQLEASDAFMYAGYNRVKISIPPHSIRQVTYNLYPLLTGNVPLPRLQLTLVSSDDDHMNNELTVVTQDQIDKLLQRSLPTHFFVMPQSKGNPTRHLQDIKGLTTTPVPCKFVIT